MPNHVTNTLEIYLWDIEASKGCVDRALDIIRGEDYDDGEERIVDFRSVIPEPCDNPYDIVFNDSKYGSLPGWYGWRCENWGTKWNAYAQSIIDRDDTTVTIKFDTAWSPPLPFIEALRKRLEDDFPSDKFEVYVSGMWVEEGYQSAGVF